MFRRMYRAGIVVAQLNNILADVSSEIGRVSILEIESIKQDLPRRYESKSNFPLVVANLAAATF
jgi:hypothetical protein